MADDNIELSAKLKLDTSEAEAKMKALDVPEKPAPKPEGDDGEVELPKETKESLKNLFSGPKGILNIGRLAKSATGGVSGLSGAFSGLAGAAPKIGGVITLILAAVSAIVKLAAQTDSMKEIKRSFESVGDMLKIVLAPIISFFAELAKVVSETLLALKPVFELLSVMLKSVLTPLLAVIKPILLLVQLVLKVLEPIVEVITQLISLLADIYDTISATLLELFEDLLKPVMDFFTSLTAAIKQFFSTIKEFFGIGSKTQYSTTGTDVGNLKTSLDTWETSGDKLTKGDEETIDAINNGFAGLNFDLGEFLDNITASVSQWFKDLWVNIENVAALAWDGISSFAATVWDTVSGFAKTAWEGISNFAKNTWDKILNFAKGAWEGVKSAFSSIVEWFKSLFGGVGKAVSGVGEWVSGAVSKVGDWFGSWWPFADGGTLSLGTQVWGMNEQGNPEFLFNAGGHDTVINKEILADAVYQAVVRANNTAGSQRLEVSVKEGTAAGPRELVQWLLPSLKFLSK